MWMMKGLLLLFIMLALGYVLCVIAEKQKGLLKTVGYTFGIAIIVITLLLGLLSPETGAPMMKGKMGMMKCRMMKNCPMVKK